MAALSSLLPVTRGDSLRRRFILLVAVVAGALLGLSALVIERAHAGARAWAEAETLATARALAQMVDYRFATAAALLQGLAVSPSLRAGDLEAFGRDLGSAADRARLGSLALSRADGTLLLHRAVEGAAPPAGLAGNTAIGRAAASGRTAVSDLFDGVVLVAVPVPGPAAGPADLYVLSLALPADGLAEALAAQGLPPGTVAALIDTAGVVVARSPGQREYAGTGLVPEVRATVEAGEAEAVVRTRRVDGVPASIGLVRAPASGFRIAIGVAQDAFLARLGTTLLLALLAGGGLVLAALLLLLLLARRVSRGIGWLGTLADPVPQRMGYRQGLAEIDAAAAALTGARARQEAAQAALARREAGFRAAFEAPVIGMAQIDLATGAILLANDRFCGILGHPAAALLDGGNLFTLLATALTEAQRAALGQGRAVTLAAEYARPDGATLWLELGLAAIRDAAVQPPRAVVVLEDMSGRHRDTQRQRLLTRELAHRAVNALTVVQAAIRLTPQEDAAAYAAAVEARVAALARAHGLLAHGGWSGAELEAVVAGELAPFLPARPGAAGRTRLAGPPLMLRAEAVQPLAMVVHELATNSTKYGALSRPAGQVEVAWSVEARPGFLQLRWSETGGPPVLRPPARRGFGSRLIEATVRGQLGGGLQLSWLPGGLVCLLAIPLGRAVREAGGGRGRSGRLI